MALTFFTVSPVANAPQCLASLSSTELLAPAPRLAGGSSVHGGSGVGPRLSVLSAGQRDPAQHELHLDVAACLTSPVILEENAGEIIRDCIEEEAQGAQSHLQLRCVSGCSAQPPL